LIGFADMPKMEPPPNPAAINFHELEYLARASPNEIHTLQIRHATTLIFCLKAAPAENDIGSKFGI
jgi:hypothetical protein